MPTAVAAFIAERAQRSIYLLEGLRAALLILGQPALARITEMISEDAAGARQVCMVSRSRRRAKRAQKMLCNLQQLGRLNPEGWPLALEIARQLGSEEGFE